jgi:hypothetical protein
MLAQTIICPVIRRLAEELLKLWPLFFQQCYNMRVVKMVYKRFRYIIFSGICS